MYNLSSGGFRQGSDNVFRCRTTKTLGERAHSLQCLSRSCLLHTHFSVPWLFFLAGQATQLAYFLVSSLFLPHIFQGLLDLRQVFPFLSYLSRSMLSTGKSEDKMLKHWETHTT